MAIIVGIVLALLIGAVTTLAGLHRDRALYSAITIVVGSYYSLFALMGGSTTTLVIESLIGAVFFCLAIAGFRSTLWIVVAALAAHGLFDLVHPHIYENRGVPHWWPLFCAAYDLVAAAFLAWLISSKRVRASAA